MEKLKHFSHSHPLGLKEIQMDEGGHKLVICGLCEKQILGPAYSCSEFLDSQEMCFVTYHHQPYGSPSPSHSREMFYSCEVLINFIFNTFERYNTHFTNTRFSSQTLVNSIGSPVAKLACHTTTVSSTSVTRVNPSPLMLNVLSCPPLLYMKLTSTPYVRETIHGIRMDIAVHVDSIFIITGSDVRIAISVYAVIVLYSLKPSSIDGIDIPSSLPILLSLIIPKISIVKFARKK
ncbi:unnamed protein product [Ilex paraguariensis]|uniref:Uncharacterized protein n=1 Tax=Ilex paraguariensis TaxID=185542 RepID=A0ABC8T667_9AQUA